MNIPDIPNNEEARLASLRALDILDTPFEERLDRITRLASQLFDVPIALLSLIDLDRQWFKSSMGLDVSETSRAISFCGHAILSPSVMIIPDARIDPRFADNPLVVGEPYIRFYAGCPLYAENGLALGTLCLIDQRPRILSTIDLDVFRDLALMAEREILQPEPNILDDETNICNRKGFLLLAEKGLNLCARRDILASLVFIELEKVNDASVDLANDESDRILLQFSEYLKMNLEHSALVARIDADQFVVLLIGVSTAGAELAISKFKAAIEALHIRENWQHRLPFDYGVAEFNASKHSTVDKLMTDADIAMYDNKKQKRYAAREELI